MDYKEQIDEYFKRYKQGESTTKMYNVIVHEMSQKYRQYLSQGYTKGETEDKLSAEISNLRGYYPVLSSLPLYPVSRGDLARTGKIMTFLLYLVVSTALYFFVPILAFIPQLIMGFLFFNWANVATDKNVVPARRRFVLLLVFLLIIQAIGMWLRYPASEEGLVGIVSVYVIVFFFFTIVCTIFMNQKKESPKQSFISILITGPVLTRNVNMRIYFLFAFYSIIAYAGHLFMYFFENLFNTW